MPKGNKHYKFPYHNSHFERNNTVISHSSCEMSSGFLVASQALMIVMYMQKSATTAASGDKIRIKSNDNGTFQFATFLFVT